MIPGLFHPLFVPFFRSKEVLRFEFKEEKLKELKEIVLEGIPVDLFCDEQNILILQQSADQPLVAYHINKEREVGSCDVGFNVLHFFCEIFCSRCCAQVELSVVH